MEDNALTLFLAAVLSVFGVTAWQSRPVPATDISDMRYNPQPAISEAQDVLARTVWGEARDQGYNGMQAVANVVMNRLAKAPRFGSTVVEVCKKPWQFSAWNANDPNLRKMLEVTQKDYQFRQAMEIASKAINGTLPDITGGADHYHARFVNPYWAEGQQVVAQVGAHEFYNLG